LLACAAGFALAPAAAQAEVFDGPYAGVEAGLGILKAKGTTFAGPVSSKDESGVVSAVLGYRLPLGESSPVVVGAEGNVGLYTNGGDAHYGISGIGGFRIGESALIYLRAGYGWLDGVETGDGKGLDGLVLGGGAEMKLTDSLSARADYRHIDYGGFDYVDNSFDFKGDEIVASLLFNF
jgi:outer membrane immunogenic protein